MTLTKTGASVGANHYWTCPMRMPAALLLILVAVNVVAAEPHATSNDLVPTIPSQSANTAEASSSAAETTAAVKRRVAPNIQELVENQRQIRAEIEAGKGKYRGMPARERRDLYAHQDNLLNLLEGKQSFDELNEDDKIEAFNELEWIKARLTQAEDDRLVCEVVRASGSNLTRRVCKSVKQLRLESQQAQQMLDTKGQCIITEMCGSGG